jgi:hypothetical protein
MACGDLKCAELTCVSRSTTQVALSGYSIYAAYAPSILGLQPSIYSLYSQLTTQPEKLTDDSKAQLTSAPLDAMGYARTTLHVSKLSLPEFDLSPYTVTPAASFSGAAAAAATGWPGTTWIRVVPRTDAGESRSKGAACPAPDVCGPLPTMALPAPDAPTNLIAAAMGSGKISLSWTPPPQPALLAHELRFRISYAPLLGEPALDGRGRDTLQAAGPFVEVSEVRGYNALVDTMPAGSWILFHVHARNLNSDAYPSDRMAAAAVLVDALVPPVRALQVSHSTSHTLTVKWCAPAWYVSDFALSISQLLDTSGWGGVGVVAQAGET